MSVITGERRLRLNRELSEACSEAEHPSKKLTPEDVREIRERYAAGESNKAELGREYTVSQSAIVDVVHGYSWKHVDGPVTSHFGRHRFTTWWRVQQDANRELVKYMRGDSVDKGSMDEPIDSYLHTYYEDVEDLYQENIYRLGI